jgi:hypothetical protein
MCIRRETREKARRSLAFSRVSKPHTHITHMLRQCTNIVYVWILKKHIKYRCEFEPRSGEVYSIQQYVINLSVTCDRSVVFSWYSGFLHQELTATDIAEILLRVALNTISITS